MNTQATEHQRITFITSQERPRGSRRIQVAVHGIRCECGWDNPPVGNLREAWARHTQRGGDGDGENG